MNLVHIKSDGGLVIHKSPLVREKNGPTPAHPAKNKVRPKRSIGSHSVVKHVR